MFMTSIGILITLVTGLLNFERLMWLKMAPVIDSNVITHRGGSIFTTPEHNNMGAVSRLSHVGGGVKVLRCFTVLVKVYGEVEVRPREIKRF